MEYTVRLSRLAHFNNKLSGLRFSVCRRYDLFMQRAEYNMLIEVNERNSSSRAVIIGGKKKRRLLV